MEKFDYNAKMLKFLGSVFVMLFFVAIAYGAYLFYIFKKMPEVKTQVSGLYHLFTDGYTGGNSRAASPTPAANNGWTTINTKTSDQTIERLSTMSDKEVKDKLKEAEGYEKLLDGNSLKLLKLIAGIVSKSKDSPVISTEDEKQLKEELEKVLKNYQHQRLPGVE
jgi:hypothetical protein